MPASMRGVSCSMLAASSTIVPTIDMTTVVVDAAGASRTVGGDGEASFVRATAALARLTAPSGASAMTLDSTFSRT